MEDLTILFLTVNKVPKAWAEYHKKVLLEAAGSYPIISISREPIELGTNLIQEEPISCSNVYRQMLRGAKLATTPYVAMAEDDTLYPREHFVFYRPPLDTFAYNRTLWALFTWRRPTYSWKTRKSNSTLIAPREALIKALEERFAKYPDGIPPKWAGELGRDTIERRMGVTIQKSVEVFSKTPVVLFHHDYEMDLLAVKHRKRPFYIQAYDIPYWGKAEELVKNFK